MKLKTEQEVKQQADKEAEEYHPLIKDIDPDKYFVITQSFYEGASWLQREVLASASESFEEWWESDKDIPEILGRASERVAGITNMAQRCSILSEFWAKEAWRASKLSDAQWFIDSMAKVSEIERLQKENEDLKRTVAKINDDFWFMINLIERYSTDKDETLKDVLERMKFRKPMLEKWLKGEKK